MVEKIAFLLPRKNTHNDNYIFAFVVCARIGETCWLYLRVYMWEIMYCLKWRYFKKGTPFFQFIYYGMKNQQMSQKDSDKFFRYAYLLLREKLSKHTHLFQTHISMTRLYTNIILKKNRPSLALLLATPPLNMKYGTSSNIIKSRILFHLMTTLYR